VEAGLGKEVAEAEGVEHAAGGAAVDEAVGVGETAEEAVAWGGDLGLEAGIDGVVVSFDESGGGLPLRGGGCGGERGGRGCERGAARDGR